MNDTQVYASGGGNHRDGDDDDVAAGTVQIDLQTTDSLLDEIDTLLESNAEEFVNSYVQKGGQ